MNLLPTNSEITAAITNSPIDALNSPPIIGILVFVAGFFLLSTEPVGSALMSGGIWAVFYGVVKNWRNFSESWRFLLLFVLLIVLIWLALRFNRKTSGFSKIKRKFRRR